MLVSILLALVSVLTVGALVLAVQTRSRVRRLERDLGETRRMVGEGVRERIQAVREDMGRLLLRVSQGKPISETVALEAGPYEEISGDEAWKLLETHRLVTLLDVRDPHEYAAGHLPGALWIPLGQLRERWSEVPREADYVIVHCAAGSRSAAACEYLGREHGYLNLYNLTGGLRAWPGPVEAGGVS